MKCKCDSSLEIVERTESTWKELFVPRWSKSWHMQDTKSARISISLHREKTNRLKCFNTVSVCVCVLVFVCACDPVCVFVCVCVLLLEVVWEPQVLVEQVAEVRHRERVHPVVIWRVSVALLHHQTKPKGHIKSLKSSEPFWLHSLLRAHTQASVSLLISLSWSVVHQSKVFVYENIPLSCPDMIYRSVARQQHQHPWVQL